MEKIKNWVKGNRWVYNLYFCIMSFLVNLLKLFVKADDKLLLFVSYGGRHYNDSPRLIYEAMLKDPRFKDYRFIWAFVNPDDYKEVPDRIKIDTFTYFKTALKARAWITNVMIERALKFSGKHTFYFNTTHGLLPKTDGPDSKGNFKSNAKMQFDCTLAQSEYEKEIAHRAYGVDFSTIKIAGFPRNDHFSAFSEEERMLYRRKIGIPEGKKAILYAPTFRETTVFYEKFDLDIAKWKEKLGDEYVLLYRAHPVLSTDLKQQDDFFIDCTKYEIVEELMIAADILVSDYSGIFHDYSILHRPIYLWTYDYDEYVSSRGLYYDVRKELPYAEKEDDLLELICNGNQQECIERVIKFQEKFVTEHGSATEKSLDLIYDNLKNSD